MIYRLWGKQFGIALLATFIITALVTPVSAQKNSGRRGEKRQSVHDSLNLSSDQRAKLQKHIAGNRSKIKSIRNELRESYAELYRESSNYHPNNDKIRSAVKKINSKQLDLLNTNLESQIELREILKREQFQDLRKAVSDHNWQARDDMNGGGPEIDKIKQLGLSSAQQEKIKKLFQSSNKKMKAAAQKVQSNSNSLRQLYSNYDLDEQKAKSRIASLNRAQQDVLNIIVGRQEELRKILTQQQYETLSKSIRRYYGGFRGKRTGK